MFFLFVFGSTGCCAKSMLAISCSLNDLIRQRILFLMTIHCNQTHPKKTLLCCCSQTFMYFKRNFWFFYSEIHEISVYYYYYFFNNLSTNFHQLFKKHREFFVFCAENTQMFNFIFSHFTNTTDTRTSNEKNPLCNTSQSNNEINILKHSPSGFHCTLCTSTDPHTHTHNFCCNQFLF